MHSNSVSPCNSPFASGSIHGTQAIFQAASLLRLASAIPVFSNSGETFKFTTPSGDAPPASPMFGLTYSPPLPASASSSSAAASRNTSGGASARRSGPHTPESVWPPPSSPCISPRLFLLQCWSRSLPTISSTSSTSSSFASVRVGSSGPRFSPLLSQGTLNSSAHWASFRVRLSPF